jgi:hypothetical protein
MKSWVRGSTICTEQKKCQKPRCDDADFSPRWEMPLEGVPTFEFLQEPSAPAANDASCCIHAGFYVTLLGQSQ